MGNKEEGVVDLYHTKDLAKPYKELRSFISYIDIGFFGLILIFLYLIWNGLVYGNWIDMLPTMVVIVLNFFGLVILHILLVKQRRQSLIAYAVIFGMNALIGSGSSMLNGTFSLNIFTAAFLAVPLIILLQINNFLRQGILK